MKITMYELLGLVKDGKAPSKIKYLTYEYEFNQVDKEYQRWFNGLSYGLGEDRRLDIILNDEVEILEEKKKIPEKINWKPKESMARPLSQKEQIEVIARRTEKLKKELNILIDYLKSKGE